MNIVYCTDRLYRSGGMESVLTMKANYLAGLDGYKVYIITFHQKGRQPFFPLDARVELIDLGVNIRLPFTGRRYRQRLQAILERIHADILISMSGVELEQLSRMDTACPKIAEFHFSYRSYYIRGKQRRLKAFVRAAAAMDRFVVLTRQDSAEWEKHLNNVVQIYNPASYGQRTAAALERKRCISGGRLVGQKNYADMLKLWAKVAPHFPDWRLDIFGTGPLEKKLRRQISELGIGESVSINPPSKQFDRELFDSSIYLMTSIYEGFPMVLLEAAASGVPAVAMDCPAGPSEAITDGKSGYVVAQGDMDAMSGRLTELMSDRELRLEMGRNAQQHSALFSEERVMKCWTDLFGELRGQSL